MECNGVAGDFKGEGGCASGECEETGNDHIRAKIFPEESRSRLSFHLSVFLPCLFLPPYVIESP